MNFKDRVVIITGGASGIGEALCRRFAAEDVRGIVVADLDPEGTTAVASEIGGLAVPTDVSDESELVKLVAQATEHYGKVDIFCSNAGIMVRGGEDVAAADWQRIWDVNVMAHVYAARAVLPQMLERGEGYLVQTASAAGLLSQVDSAPYAATKHAAVGLAEWLAITYGGQGIRVSCLCPQGVRTKMMLGEDGNRPAFLADGAVSPEQVAETVINGIGTEQFLMLPHPEVLDYMQRKSGDYDRWLGGMRRLRAKVQEKYGLEH